MLGLFKYAKKYKWQAMACPFLMVGEVWLELYIIRLMGYLVDNGIQKADMHYIFRYIQVYSDKYDFYI